MVADMTSGPVHYMKTDHLPKQSGPLSQLGEQHPTPTADDTLPELLTFARFHQLTPGLSGPERARVFAALPYRCQQDCWNALDDLARIALEVLDA
jgi:hypothetical protein